MEDASRSLRIVVINGSVRPGNYTAMASAYVVDELKKNPRVAVDVVNPAEFHLHVKRRLVGFWLNREIT